MRRSTGHRCTSHCALWGALVAFNASFVSGVAVAGDRVSGALRLEGPTEVIGDGASPLQVRVKIASTGREPTRVTIGTNAGRIVSKRELERGMWEVTIVPPRVVEPMTLVVEAKARAGQRGKVGVRLLPAIARAELSESNGPLALRVPKYLILGHDEHAVVTFRGRSLSPIRLYASTGAIERPTSDGIHRYRAIFTPPADRLPRVAVIVAASEDGSVVDWAAIQLYGRPLVSAMSEPHATVTARVAGTEYGPLQADRRGRVDIRVLVPPGVAQGQTIARDAMGNERTVPLKLGVPAGHEEFAICPAASEGLYFFAVDASGAPRKGLPIRVESSLGALSKAQWSEGGYYALSLALPSNATLGQTIHLRAQIDAEKGSEVVCESTVVGEAPKGLRLSVVPKVWAASSATQVQVTAHASFSGERKPRTVPLLATASIGEVSPFYPRNPGLYEASWRIPAHFEGRDQAKLTVVTLGPRPVQGQVMVQLRPGPPSRLDVEVAPQRLNADGRSETRLTARVFDAHGNPADTALRVVDAKGGLSPFVRGSTGVYSSTYQAPRSSSLTKDDVTIRDQGDAMRSKVRIGLTPTSLPVRFWGAVGYSTNLALVQAPMGVAGVSVRLPALRERLAVGIDVGYLASRSSALDAAGTETAALATTLTPLSLRVTYELRVARFVPYFGFGAGVSLVHLDVSAPSAGTWTEWTARPLVAAMAGTLMRLGPGWALIEAGLRYIPVNEPFVSGNVGGLLGSAGYLYEL